MGMITIYSGKSKPAKKKPGWQKEQAEYEAWQKKMASLSLGASRTKTRVAQKLNPIVPQGPVVSPDRLNRPPSLNSFGGAGTKPVARPDILYKDDPDMLARELKARERKFATAPAYNKGGSVLITDEMMKDITAGKTRRR